jgi:hypothetical protein
MAAGEAAVQPDRSAAMNPAARHADPAAHDTLEAALRAAVAFGLFAVLLLPAGRGYSQAVGWLPLWLVAMPLSAWWALHGFALPRWSRRTGALARARRRTPQARRPRRDRPAPRLARAA